MFYIPIQTLVIRKMDIDVELSRVSKQIYISSSSALKGFGLRNVPAIHLKLMILLCADRLQAI